MHLSKRDARKIFLKQQGLLNAEAFGRGPTAVTRAVQRLSYLQIDTISVVNRAHEHVLTSRIGNFNVDHLHSAVQQRELFEYWSHAAAFLPFEHFRYCLPVMRGWAETRERDKKLAQQILGRILQEGPMQSRDFEDTEKKKRGGWWEWKPAKKMLEHLYLSGELMVSHREGFQKVFDLPENVVPSHIDTSEPTTAQWCDHLALTMAEALGVATAEDLGYSKSTVQQLARISLKAPLAESINRLVEEGRLLQLNVADHICYALPSVIENLPLRTSRRAVRLLSPFDNLVINRKRLAQLFDFQYQLECYVPAEKRQYGYFALPMLYGDEFIGRADIKAERKTAQLRIKNLVLEDHIKPEDRLLEALRNGIDEFAANHNCSEVLLDHCTPAMMKPLLERKLVKVP